MRRRWKILTGLMVLTVAGVWLLSHARNPALRDLEDTRRALRQGGFKLELGEFDFFLTPEVSRRAALLGRTTRGQLTNVVGPDPIIGNMVDFPALLTPVGTNALVATWKLDNLKTYRGGALWPDVRERLEAHQAQLEAARQAAVSGPIRFAPIDKGHPGALLPYLGDMKNLATMFGALTLLALHDGEREAAWTNLLAVTCLATAYSPEPIDVSQACRFAYVDIACDTTWSAMQAPGWTEGQLASLQKRWESLELWSGLPETAAYWRADTAALLEWERRQPLSLGELIKEMLRSPRNAWSAWAHYCWEVRYRRQGSYEDEKALLLYYRDRELELRRAVRAASWAEMRQLPGATNFVPFASGMAATAKVRVNLRQMRLNFLGRGVGLLGRAAETETRRRLVVTALALERYRGRHACYPVRLADLVPELLEAAPVDFMDGQPLRYRLTADDHFLLYSVGLDCVDNGGQMRRAGGRGMLDDDSFPELGFPQGTDLVWPRPASAAEIERHLEEEKQAEETRTRDAEEAQAEAGWTITTRRQSNVEKALRAEMDKRRGDKAAQPEPGR